MRGYRAYSLHIRLPGLEYPLKDIDRDHLALRIEQIHLLKLLTFQFMLQHLVENGDQKVIVAQSDRLLAT